MQHALFLIGLNKNKLYKLPIVSWLINAIFLGVHLTVLIHTNNDISLTYDPFKKI